MANTISTYTYRRKYRLGVLAQLLRKALVAEAICEVNRSEERYIDSPYGSQPTTVIQAITGDYTPANFTTTDDGLTVTDEFIVSEHIYDFEKVLTKFDIFSARTNEQAYSVAEAIDKYVINNLTEDATGAYTTPTGGFTTPANVDKIIADLTGSLTGYQGLGKGYFLVIENTDVSGITQAQMTNGYSFADAALNNGFSQSYGGVDIYVKRTGTFVDATLGTKTVTNAGHRVFGIKNVATYAFPRGIQYEEKGVSGKTGKEIVTYGYIGFKLWAPKTALVVDITLA